MATLASLPAVKRKLGVPTTDESLDAAIQAVLDAASDWVEDYTGYSADAEAARVDIFESVRIDEKLYLSRRPVSSVASMTARDRGSTTEAALTYDLVKSALGYLWVVPNTTQLMPWSSQSGHIRRWDIVTVTYAADAASGVPDIVDAVAELTAFWYKNDCANVAAQGAGPFSTTFIVDRAIPVHVMQRLYRHRRKLARIVGAAS